tara:strand:+ start:36264 stop:36479 length:216 start_codon:yes stop_codon:yes gene_type:complete
MILLIIDILVFRLLLIDWKETRKAASYESSSPIERIRITVISWFIFAALLIFDLFLIYFLMSSIDVTPLWN